MTDDPARVTDDIVQLRGLTVDYRVDGGLRRAVHEIDLDIAPGEAYGLVGESGSGKSTVAFALTGHVPAGARVAADRAVVAGHEILALRGPRLRDFRRSQIGVVYQEPGRALNPTATVGAQIAEAHRLRGLDRTGAQGAVQGSLRDVGLERIAAIGRRYPHELSGGQQQRVVLAMALAGRPRLLLLDEPTTGLDASVQAEVLALIDRLRAQVGFASLLISHDLHLVAAHSDRVAVMQAGRIVETTDARGLTTRPAHGYTRDLIRALPSVDDPIRPAVDEGGPVVLRACDIRVSYDGVVALDGIDLALRRGETLGIVGESGSGKSTLGRVVAGLVRHTGTVEIDAPSSPPPVQIVFQSPDASLNPRRSVAQTLRRAARLLGGDLTADELAERVGLPGDLLGKLPHQLSGGQKQRVAIARAFAGHAPVVVCDEPTSALDVSVQARVLDLLVELQERTGVAYLFISHDLTVVRGIAHRVAVLRGGRVQETAETERIFGAPEHPYTRALLAAADAAGAAGTAGAEDELRRTA